ncbi:MAG: hypothetical protein ACE5DT_08055 [Nitrosopumilus sp.]
MNKNERRDIQVLTKPISLEDICDIIDSTIGMKEIQEQNASKMTSVLIDDDIYEKLRILQAQKIQNESTSCSFSEIVNEKIRMSINEDNI